MNRVRGWQGEEHVPEEEEWETHDKRLPYINALTVPPEELETYNQRMPMMERRFNGTPWPVGSSDMASPERYDAIRRGERYAPELEDVGLARESRYPRTPRRGR